MDKFELNILGCGSATTSMRHMPTSQVLNIRDNLFMIDCGEAAQLGMLRQRLKFARLNHIFISHLHGDHCFGLPGLLSTLDLHGRSGALTIHINAARDGTRWHTATGWSCYTSKGHTLSTCLYQSARHTHCPASSSKTSSCTTNRISPTSSHKKADEK